MGHRYSSTEDREATQKYIDKGSEMISQAITDAVYKAISQGVSQGLAKVRDDAAGGTSTEETLKIKGKLWTSESPEYEEARRQYATSSYPADKMTPGVIAQPLDDHDIRLILAFARDRRHRWNVIARSGGNQYSGLSSGGANTIVVDMSLFRKDPIEHEEGSNIITLGPCNYLGEIAPYIQHHGLALPFGDCMYVNVGGHVQTGGFGNTIRGLGLCCDYVTAFDIIRADGIKMHVTRPTGRYTVYVWCQCFSLNFKRNLSEEHIHKYEFLEYLASHLIHSVLYIVSAIEVDVSVRDEKWDVDDLNNNDAMFWAVMGGNPSSFGIITEIKFECIRDKDHPNSTGIKVIWGFTKELLKSLMTAFTEILVKGKAGEIPPDYDFFFTINGDRDSGKVIFQGIYSNINGKREKYDPKWFKIIMDAAKGFGLELGRPINDDKYHSVSNMMLKAVLLEKKREFEFPYKASCLLF